MKCRLLCFMVLCICSVTTLSAQISVADYLADVEQYSYVLDRAEMQIIAAEANMSLARKDYLPSFSVGQDLTVAFRDRGDERRTGWNVRGDILQPIYNGGAVRATAKQSEQLYEQSKSMLQDSRLDILYEAEYTYWALSRAEIYHRSIADYLNIVKSLHDVVSRRFEEGYISKSDLLQVESRMSDAEYQLSAAEQSYLVALHNFNLMRGAASDKSVVLLQSITDTIYMPQRESVDDIVERHPAYQSSLHAEAVARWGVKLARSRYLPTIDVGVYGVWQPSSPNVKGAGTTIDGGVVLRSSFPIFHFGARKQAVSLAESRHGVSQVAIAELYDRISLDESNGWTNLVTTRSRVESTSRNLVLATENLEISTYSYGEGMATILDVLQAQISWLQIYTNAITAQFDYAVAVAAYRRITATMP